LPPGLDNHERLEGVAAAGVDDGASEDLNRAEGNIGKSDIEVRCCSLLGQTGNVAGQRTLFYLLPGLNVEISASAIREMARRDPGLRRERGSGVRAAAGCGFSITCAPIISIGRVWVTWPVNIADQDCRLVAALGATRYDWLGELIYRMTQTQAHQETRILVQAAAAVCEDKKGQDTRILELDRSTRVVRLFSGYSASNDRQRWPLR